MKYSIIIPTYKGENTLEQALSSIEKIKSNSSFEVFVIDDCSPLRSYRKIEKICEKYPIVRLYRQKKNEGPGIARNKGLAESTGDYVLFLDQDDTFNSNILTCLNQCLLKEPNLDIIFFNWKYDKNSLKSKEIGGRTDLAFLKKNVNKDLIQEFLLGRIEQEVIFSAFRRDFLVENNIKFRESFHEDIAFILKCLIYIKKYTLIKRILYIKKKWVNSITNITINKKHITGCFVSLEQMYFDLKNSHLSIQQYQNDYIKCVISILAYRLILVNLLSDKIEREKLLENIYQKTLNLQKKLHLDYKSYNKTKYQKIFRFFLQNFTSKNGSDKIFDFLDEIKNKLWSCFDLQTQFF